MINRKAKEAIGRVKFRRVWLPTINQSYEQRINGPSQIDISSSFIPVARIVNERKLLTFSRYMEERSQKRRSREQRRTISVLPLHGSDPASSTLVVPFVFRSLRLHTLVAPPRARERTPLGMSLVPNLVTRSVSRKASTLPRISLCLFSRSRRKQPRSAKERRGGRERGGNAIVLP